MKAFKTENADEICKSNVNSGMKLRAFKVARTVITLISILVIFGYIAKNYKAINISDYHYLLFSAFIPFFVIPTIVNNRWKYFLSLNGVNESVLSLAKINFISAFYGIVLPSSQGNDAIRILMIERRHPEKRGMVGSSVILERIIGLITLCLVATVASLFVPRSISRETTIYIVWIASVLIITLSIFFVSKISYRVLSHIVYTKAFKHKVTNNVKIYVQKVHESLYRTATFSVFLKSFMLILMFQVSTILNVYLVFSALGIKIPLLLHLAIMPVVYIISMIPITISGIGLREGVFAFMYGKIGVSAPQAVVASLLNYSILTIIPAVIGMLIIVTTNLHLQMENKPNI